MKTVSQNTPTIYSATTPENNPPQLVASLVPDEQRITFMAPEPDDDDDETWVLFNAMNGNRAEMSPEAAGIAACLMTYSHHACRTECYAMTVHYYRLRDYALQRD
ncbi:antirestriction protein [Escherichia coli]|uniref:antirestriction protein n=1 Tax=Escherichia coli TaxID=562 RepID=UPI000BE3B430|nr:antirestriction protein [Escherichia coli]PDM27347.1 hypothetical protein CQR81_26510 [Escherichia coli]